MASETMNAIRATTAVALVAWSSLSHAQTGAAVTQTVPDGLSDLEAMTFDCPKAALNAAAREAAKVTSQGTYQFAYFNIINDSHHSTYEIHFKSNYHGEPDLNYCVILYCQQGWDPKTAATSVTRIPNEPQRAGGTGHGVACGNTQAPRKDRLKR